VLLGLPGKFPSIFFFSNFCFLFLFLFTGFNLIWIMCCFADSKIF
jgi:hypothetical protein